LSDALGVELIDFDITEELSPAEQAELRDLFRKHHLVLVRGQNPSLADHDRFTANFGPLAEMLSNGDTGYISNKIAGGAAKPGGPPVAVTGTDELLWHADGTYGPCPGIATCLMAIDVDADATPTLFASGSRALDKLPADLRARIEPLKAVHMRDTVASNSAKPWRDHSMPKEAFDEEGRLRSYEHPIVYRGPHSDTPLIFVNFLMTSHIADLPREEGDALLEDLYARLYADDNVYAHHWQPGDILIWDNIALQHCRPSNMGNATRHLRRLVLDGWHNDDGTVLEWWVTSSPRDLARYGRTAEAARYGGMN
jgi:taurine dioxygenase